ncbi:MAG: hypothetical protein ACLQNE_31560 [Thermoguttaceae bacterium]|jgi:hypothetical protein
MRLPESQIKQAILHPEAEIREQALHYLYDVLSRDESVMPLVIQAVEKHGKDKSFSIIREAECLAQTEPTIDWLMDELRRQFDLGSKRGQYRLPARGGRRFPRGR